MLITEFEIDFYQLKFMKPNFVTSAFLAVRVT